MSKSFNHENSGSRDSATLHDTSKPYSKQSYGINKTNEKLKKPKYSRNSRKLNQ